MPDGVYINWKMREAIYCVPVPGRSITQKDSKRASCCYADFTEQLAHSPVIKVNNSYWNRCGQLSKSCEDFTKKIECFYRCSPHAAHWIHPNYTAAIQSVPLCQSFCDDW
ncbi:riboflavin-binding protein [Limosa lapponica baueri]|uniref:Riboflavin-binding protein n=1 Tax=Limosa lapponica baueri TaxID=1758121 RepID=A0A2I0TKU5_LIMLA|nr:riboflavin-binding protein [Limosa lapponica baueri]